MASVIRTAHHLETGGERYWMGVAHLNLVNLSLCTPESHMWSGRTAPLILNISIGRR
jgi:hypothetical protein